MDETSYSLLQRLANPADEAWYEFHALYLPFIMRQIQRYPRLAGCAEDIAQEVLLVVQGSIAQFDRRRTGSFRAWLRQVTHHRIMTALRLEKRFPALIDFADEIANELHPWTDPSSDASLQWDADHDQTLLRHVLEVVRRQSKPENWQAFHRYVLQAEPAAQVAQALGITINQVHQSKSRTIKMIRVLLKDLVDNPGEFLSRSNQSRQPR